MNKETLIKLIENIEMKDIKEVKIEYVTEKGYGYSPNEKTETLIIEK